MTDEIYTNPEYRYEWPVSFYERIRQNKRNTAWMFVVFGLVNVVSFAFYGAAGLMILMGLLGVTAGGGLSGDVVSAFTFGLPIGAVVGVVVAVVTSIVALTRDGIGFVSRSGAVDATASDDPRVASFRNAVENMAIAGGMPAARPFVMSSDALNAFAVGDGDANGSVVVTTGLLSALDAREVEAVVAHEMSHIYNRDSLLMTVALVLAGTALVLPELSGRMMFISGDSDGDSDSDGGGGGGGAALVLIGLALWVVTWLVSKLATALLKASISQEREYLADATAARMCRNPDGLASALHKISQSDMSGIPEKMDRMEALFIATPIRKGKRTGRMFNTHPPIEERIRRLMAM